MIDIYRTLQLLDVAAESDLVQAEAIDAINYLREENARLRETLQYIADPYHNSTTSKDRLMFLAREALAAIREGDAKSE